jgi:hypothetical protein
MDTLPRKVVGMANADYFAQNDFDSRSFFVAVLKGGGSAQRWLDLGHRIFEGNSATSLGSDFDTLIMGLCEGHHDIDHYLAIAPADVLGVDGRRGTKAYKEWEAETVATGRIPCNEEYAFKLRTMAESLLANPAARKCVTETVETQVSVFFELNGHRVKVRPDGCAIDYWWDLKSTSAPWDALYRSVFDYGYAEQEWLYVRAAMAMGMDHFRMPFVFVHSVPPYDCQVFYLPQDVVDEAGRRMERVMEEVRLRRETGIYTPATFGEITELVIPPWAQKKEEVLL